jgi:hypothetical protein
MEWSNVIQRQTGRTNKASTARTLGVADSTLRRWCPKDDGGEGDSPSLDKLVALLRDRREILPDEFVADLAVMLSTGTGLRVQVCRGGGEAAHHAAAVEEQAFEAQRAIVNLADVTRRATRDGSIDADEALQINAAALQARKIIRKIESGANGCANSSRGPRC